MDPNLFHNFDTGLRISIVASGKLHRATSGGWWLVANHHDSGLHRHPTIARGFAETVHWDLRDPEKLNRKLNARLAVVQELFLHHRQDTA